VDGRVGPAKERGMLSLVTPSYDGRKPSALIGGLCKGLHSRAGTPLTRIQLGERRGMRPAISAGGVQAMKNKYGTQESPG
jgi:hypothetical protein